MMPVPKRWLHLALFLLAVFSIVYLIRRNITNIENDGFGEFTEAELEKIADFEYEEQPEKLTIKQEEEEDDEEVDEVQTEHRRLFHEVEEQVSPTPKIVNPHPFQYLINEEDFCSTHSSAFVLIMVESAANNSQRRQEIRETWGHNNYTFPKLKIATVFMLGYVENDDVQESVIAESDIHHDIIQEDFIDTYENITYKSIMILKWGSKFCEGAQYILKTDDDMFVNIYSLSAYLVRFYMSGAATENSFICNVWEDMSVNVDPTFRWRVPDDKRFTGKFYPKYCSGSAYIMSHDLLGPLFEQSLYTEFLRLEDVYTTGLLPRKLNPNYINMKYLYVFAPMIPGQMDRLLNDEYSVFGHVTSEERRLIWKIIYSHHHGNVSEAFDTE